MNDTSSTIAIRAEGLGKSYVIGHQRQRERYTMLRDVIARSARRMARSAVDMARGRPIIAGDEMEEFWALRNVDFSIERGEAVGIIGRNGTGKSTLLKILSRISEPSQGRVTIRGRVASLLEVGTGFHPELTGRENILLNGAILGMTRAEIRRKFDEIVAFAEVDRFLDTPVKRYSSGMYVRLAFSVAAHLESEILIVDEVLAVGDAAFQRKSLGKMDDVARHGRTILFVSHNMSAIERLCGRCITLRNGSVAFDGDVRRAVREYLDTGRDAGASLPPPERRKGNGKARFADVRCTSTVSFGEPIQIELAISVHQPLTRPDIRCLVMDTDGTHVANFSTSYLAPQLSALTRDAVVKLTIPQAILTLGSYTVTATIAESNFADPVIVDRVESAVEFEVATADPFGTGVAPTYGSVVLPHEWHVDGKRVSAYGNA